MHSRISILIFTFLFVFAGEGVSLTKSAGLSDGSTELARIISHTGSGLRLDFVLPTSSDLLFSPSNSTSAYNLEEGYTVSDGRRLPAVTYWVVVPPRDRVELEVTSQKGRRLSTDTWNAASPYIDSEVAALQKHAMDRYNPPNAAVMGRPVIMRGVRMVPVTVYPLQLSGDNEAVENSEITVDLNFSQGDAENPVLYPRFTPMSDRFADIFLSYTLNPPQHLTPRRDLAATELARMLILYPEAIDNEDNEGALDWIDNFADWKRRQGLMVDIEPIDVEHSDTDDIKDVIRDYYDPDEGPPIEFLIIIGNEDMSELEDERDENNVELFFPTYEFEIIIDNNGEPDTTTGFSDHEYSTLEGDDLAPEIIISRIKVPTYSRLIGALQRTIEYEVNPYTDEDWINNALVVIEIDPRVGPPPLDLYALMHWEQERLRQIGYDSIELLAGTADPAVDYETGIQDEISDVFAQGVSIALSDGYVYGAVEIEYGEVRDSTDWGQFEDGNFTETGRKNSFIIANFQHYPNHVVYPFFASAQEDFLNGPVAALGILSDGGRHWIMTPIIGSALTAMTYDNVYVPGYLQIITKMYLLSLIEREDTPEHYAHSVNEAIRIHWTLGDPSIDIFSQSPTQLTVENAEGYIVGETSVILHVIDEDENDVTGATVCIRQEDGIQYVMHSNTAGMAVFTVPEGLEEGELLITACKHNYKPYLSEDLMVEEAEVNLVLGDFGFDDAEHGDDDDELRNGEQVELILSITNIGEGDAEDVTGSLSCDSEWLSFEPAEIELGDIPSGQTVPYQGSVIMTLDPACPGGTLLRIQVDLESGDNVATVAFEFTTAGPVLTTAAHMIDIDENFIVGGENAAFTPTLGNIGDREVVAFTATLSSPDERITVTQAERNYNAIDPDGEATPNEPFRLNIDPLFLVGEPAVFDMHIVAEDDYDTTLTFSKIVPSREAVEPLGPDDYGYICFDSEDNQWYEAPVYDWREINWDVEDWEFNGTKIDFESDGISNWNESVVIDIPFDNDFQYYGETFDSITIATNGWVAMGALTDTAYATSFNRPIPSHSSPDGQLCILWQDLTNNGPDAIYNGLFHHYIEDEGIFVVEWSRVMVSHFNAEDTTLVDYTLNFQILLFDPEVNPTPTGDGEIIFQYKDFTAANSGGNPDRQYSTVGIRNLTGDGGLQYAYWNEYAPQAHPIENEFAIKFTPTVLNGYGSVTGRIVRHENEDAGLPNAIISGGRFTRAVTDAEGNFTLNELRIGHYTATVSLDGFNTASFEFDVAADEQTDVGNISLTHPEFSIETDPDNITELSLRPDGTELHVWLNIDNSGNGPMDYKVGVINQDSSQLSYENTENIGLVARLNEPTCYGAVFTDSFYVPGMNYRNRNGDGHMIYVLNREFEQIRRFTQPFSDSSEDGFLDLAWDGQFLWGAIYVWRGARRLFVRFDLNGNTNLVVESPFSSFKSPALVIDPHTKNLFIADDGTGIVEIDTLGNPVNPPVFMHRIGRSVGVTGLAWNEYDPDGMKLYILEKYSFDDINPTPILWKMNHETGEYRELYELAHEESVRSFRGLTIMHDFNFQRSLIALVEDKGNKKGLGADDPAGPPVDSLRFYEIGPNMSFLEDGVITDRFGIIDAAGQARVGLMINADGFPEVDIPFGVTITHNASQPVAFIPILLRIYDESNIDGDEVDLPTEFAITAVYPNPFNAMTRVEFSVDKAMPTSLKVYDLSGREVATLYEGVPETGRHQLIWDGSRTASGVYFLRLESMDKIRTVKAAVVK